MYKMDTRYRILTVYIDGQATESYFATRQIATSLLESIAKQKNATYAECFDLRNHIAGMVIQTEQQSKGWCLT